MNFTYNQTVSWENAMPMAFLARELGAAIQSSLTNQFLSGGLALAIASGITSLAWWLLRMCGRFFVDALFTRVEFPPGSPQCAAAAHWLQSRAETKRASRYLVKIEFD